MGAYQLPDEGRNALQSHPRLFTWSLRCHALSIGKVELSVDGADLSLSLRSKNDACIHPSVIHLEEANVAFDVGKTGKSPSLSPCATINAEMGVR